MRSSVWMTVVAWGAILLGPAGSVSAQTAGFGGGRAESHVSLAAEFSAPGPDGASRLFITATMKPGWHIYSITQPPGGPVRTAIKLAPSKAFKLVGDFRSSPQPEKKREAAFNNIVVESHYSSVVWHAPLVFSPGAEPAKLQIQGTVTVQPCDRSSCMPPQDLSFTAVIGSARATVDEPEPKPTVGENAPPTQPTPMENRPSGTDDNRPPSPEGKSEEKPAEGQTSVFDATKLHENVQKQLQGSLLQWMAMGFLGGVILNLMPCVLPVIGLKILSFAQQSGCSRRQAMVLNLWYSLGLLSVFVLLATLAVMPARLGWGGLFQYAGFNVFLTVIVFAMGLSFLGVWEIPIPGFVGHGRAVELAQEEGFLGAFAKGVLTTVLATPCTGPFMGTALAWALAQPPVKTYLVFLSIGTGMASPYLVLGAFPELLRFLPKPGAWMDTFKQVMGFVLLGTVAYILTFLPWPYAAPTVALLFATWAGCWWINRAGLMAPLGVRVRAWLEAVALIGVWWLILFPGIGALGIPGLRWEGLLRVMESRYELSIEQEAGMRLARIARAGTGETTPTGDVTRSANDGELPWQSFTTRAALEQLMREEKTVLVDFTANWCLTCKTLEAAVLNTDEVRQLVRKNGVVPLRADFTNGEPEVAAMLDLLGGRAVPVIAIFPAGRPNDLIFFRNGYTQKQILDALRRAGPSRSSSTSARPGRTMLR